MRYCLVMFCIVITCNCFSQDALNNSNADTSKTALQYTENIPTKSLDYLDKKYSKLTKTLEQQNAKVLKRMQDKEAKLQRKLQGIDSSKAKELFEDSKAKYAALESKLHNPVNTTTSKLKEYVPELDTMNTALKFLSSNNSSNLLSGQLSQLSTLTGNLQELQGRLQQANEIQSFIREREAQLKASLANTGLAKELLGINKECFYYQERLKEYKSLLNDKKKLEEKLIATIRNLPAFQQFMQKHSYLSQLFRLPDPSAVGQPVAAIPGLQTRAIVQQQLQTQFGSSQLSPTGGVGGGSFQQQLQSAQTAMNQLKDKVSKFGGGNSDMTMPDFHPNTEKTKTFLQRLEPGFNIQSQRSTSLLPATSDLTLTLGYRLASNKTIGIGVGYKAGLGNGWNHIRFTSEGISLRSFAEIKAKGSFWLTGGFEYNYYQRFNNFNSIKNLNLWSQSALAGISKKYKVDNGKGGSVQLLYDFIHHNPPTQALKFRIGYTL